MGHEPELPATVKATWSNGSVTSEAVSWSAVDAASYAVADAFSANGTAAGMSVTAHVNVTAAEVVQTGDETASPVLLAMVAAADLLAALAGLILRLQAKRP